jgi:hypothetical protein
MQTNKHQVFLGSFLLPHSSFLILFSVFSVFSVPLW